MKRWDFKPLAEVCEMRPPKSEARRRLKPSDHVSFVPMSDLGEGAKFFQARELKPLSAVEGSYTYFADNDVLLAKITPCFENGKLGIARDLTNGVGFGSSEYFVLRPCAKLDSEFLFYFLAQDSFREAGQRVMTGAVGHKRVPKEYIENHPMPVPPLPEQRRIVAILDDAFAGLEAMRANAEKNLQNARELFAECVRGALHTRRAGWIDTTIGDQVTLQRGFDITKAQQQDGKVPVVSSGGIKSFHNRAMAKGPGVVIGRKGTLGKVFYVAENYWPHDTTLWIKDFKGNNPRFVYHFFTALNVIHLDTGSANPALNRNLVHPIKIAWPPIKDQPAISDKIDQLHSETQSLQRLYERKIAGIAELKQSILQKAFSGQLVSSETIAA